MISLFLVMHGEEGERIFVSGFHDDVSFTDVQNLMNTFNASDLYVTSKGFAFATVPADKMKLCSFTL
mgnify:CR=1 FL=1